MSAVIAIVGRPNVGKSALFNRIAGRRIAIVHDQPGVTRDRVSAEVEWHGVPFTLVDTGGIGVLRREKTTDEITQGAIIQVQTAIEMADLVLFVVNIQEGLMPLDREVATLLRRAKKNVILVANKADDSNIENNVVDFAALAFDKAITVSAIHGRGITHLMNTSLAELKDLGLYEKKPSVDEPPQEESVPKTDVLKLAIVGRPNVGKSSIINALTQSDRVIVSAIPGTTRDAVDVPFEVETEGVKEKYILIDTAGMRKKRRVDDSIEFFSVNRSEESIARCDIVVLIMDAEMGITEQDKKIADVITEQKKSCILVVNKWDLVEADVRKAQVEESERRKSQDYENEGPKRMVSLQEFSGWVQRKMFFLDYAPVIFTSAKSGFHLPRLLEAVRYVAAQMRQKIPTSLLNRVLNEAIEKKQPVSNMGHALKFYYATQVKQAPPTFLLFVNRQELFSESYTKYITHSMRQAFGYEGCPIIVVPKARPKTITSVRRNAPKRKQRRKL